MNAFAAPAKKASTAKSPIRTISSENIKIACETQVLDQLSRMETPLEWIPIVTPLNAQNGLHIYKSETATKFVTLELGTDGQRTRVKQSDLRNFVIYDYSVKENCVTKMSMHEFDIPKSKKNPEFTDFAVASLAKESAQQHSTVLFYAWSPAMNLSVTGVNEIQKIASEMGMKLVVIADASAKDDMIKKTVMKHRWPWNYGYTLEADLLKGRNLGIHFPALLVLKNGKLNDVARPGYDTPERLKEFLQSIK